jgi:hypothetical protein
MESLDHALRLFNAIWTTDLKKKEVEKKTVKLKQDDVDRRLAELNAELDAGNYDLASVPSKSTSGKPLLSKVFKKDSFSGKSTSPAVSNDINAWAFWTITLVSLILSQTPGISWLFLPINQFTTMVHELSHALVCVLTGGHVVGLTIVGDGAGHGGLTNAQGGIQFLFAQAGYLGTAFFGCLLIFLGQYARFSKIILGVLGALVGAFTIYFVGLNVLHTGLAGIFSFLWGAAISVGLIWMAKKLDAKSANLAVLFLAVQTALNSVSCIFMLVQVYLGFIPAGGWSDATVMENMTHIPSFVWSFLWFLISCLMLGFTLWHTYGKRLFPKK